MTRPVEPDERQTRIVELLNGRNPKLAGIYRALLEAMAFPAAQGCDLARMSVIGHCGRELMNGLPAAMADVDIPRPNPNSDALKNRLPDLLKDVDLAADQDLVPVPSSAARTLHELIKTVAQEQGRNHRLASALITGGSDDKHPAISQWSEAQRFFAGWTHLDRNSGAEREIPGEDEIIRNLRIVEDVIEVRAALFFDNLHTVEDLLAVANSFEDGGDS